MSWCVKTLVSELGVNIIHFHLVGRKFFYRLDNNGIVVGASFRRNRWGLRRKRKCLYAKVLVPKW